MTNPGDPSESLDSAHSDSDTKTVGFCSRAKEGIFDIQAKDAAMGRVAAVIFAGLFLCTAGALGIVVAHLGMSRMTQAEAIPASADSAGVLSHQPMAHVGAPELHPVPPAGSRRLLDSQLTPASHGLQVAAAPALLGANGERARIVEVAVGGNTVAADEETLLKVKDKGVLEFEIDRDGADDTAFGIGHINVAREDQLDIKFQDASRIRLQTSSEVEYGRYNVALHRKEATVTVTQEGDAATMRHELQQIAFRDKDELTGGTWSIHLDGESSAAIPHNAAAAAVREAMGAMSSVVAGTTSISVVGAGTVDDPFVLDISRPAEPNVSKLRVDASKLIFTPTSSNEIAGTAITVTVFPRPRIGTVMYDLGDNSGGPWPFQGPAIQGPGPQIRLFVPVENLPDTEPDRITPAQCMALRTADSHGNTRRETPKVPATALTGNDRRFDFELNRTGSYTLRASYFVDGREIEADPVTIVVNHNGDSFPPTLAAVDQAIAGTFRTERDLLRQEVLLEGKAFNLLAQSPRNVARNLILLEDTGGSEAVFLRGGAEVKSTTAGDPNVTFGIDGELEAGRHRLLVKDLWTGESVSATVIVPEPNVLSQPAVTQVSNGVHAAFAAPANTTVYDQFLRLRGFGFPAQGRLEFMLFHRTDESGEFVQLPNASAVVPVEANESGRWEAQLRFPEAPQKYEGRLVVVGRHGTHIFSTPLALNVVANDIASEARPTIRSAKPPGGIAEQPNPTTKVVSVNATEVELSGGFVDGTITPDAVPHTQVIITDAAGKQLAAVPIDKTSTAESAWTARISGLQVGENRLTATFARGDKSGSASVPQTIIVQTVGPQVVDVQPPNLGAAAGVLQLTISFSSPLHSKSASLEHNYLLLSSGGTGLFNRGTEERIRPKTAVYEPASRSVALTFDSADIRPDVYQLRINGHKDGEASSLFTSRTNQASSSDVGGETKQLGIRDEFGNFLEGTPGQPGTDYSRDLRRAESPTVDGRQTTARAAVPGADILEVVTERVGLPGTGPYIVYPEYTEPRPYAQGVNPSDKVVTRVVRLYYFRDAHRVAQIVNRNAMSYNAQSATMARQLADQARLYANRTVDNRRAIERSAVHAASEARQAENALEDMQQALITARSQLDQTQARFNQQESQVRSRENDLEDAERVKSSAESELEQAQAAIAILNEQGMLQTDPTYLRAQARVTAAESASASAEVQRVVAERALENANAELANRESDRDAASDQVTLNEQRVSALSATVQAMREKEIQETEAMEAAEAQEFRAVEQQFRLEVAAAEEDPDTYAPGVPASPDPVQQVSVSVIGEGVIQLRGPLKGVNVIRTMINQIDAPVSQVRIGIHTVQVNGEHGDRMEPVVARIQRYIDHSRFLTAQSAQMLRNAVASVASQKAQQIAFTCPDDSQLARDQKYQDAFFGRDFMNELREMDSEFLHTGNKVLSLHSMDTTSLASALFLLGLASNETREEILGCFYSMLYSQLPRDEQLYFEASDAERRVRCREFRFLADNAQFVSFRGFFNTHIAGNDTLNPMQREFIRLAQIFKSRLITEIEMNQRILERTLIEERIGNYQEELERAFQLEQQANEALAEQRRVRQDEQVKVVRQVQSVAEVAERFVTSAEQAASISTKVVNSLLVADSNGVSIDPKDFLPSGASLSASTERRLTAVQQEFVIAYSRAVRSFNEAGIREALRQQRIGVMMAWLEDPAITALDEDTRCLLVPGTNARDYILYVNINCDPNSDPIRLRVAVMNGVAEISFIATGGNNLPEDADVEFILAQRQAVAGTELRRLIQCLSAVFRKAERFYEAVAPIASAVCSTEPVAIAENEVAYLRQNLIQNPPQITDDEAAKTAFSMFERVIRLLLVTSEMADTVASAFVDLETDFDEMAALLTAEPPEINDAHRKWVALRGRIRRIQQDSENHESLAEFESVIRELDAAFGTLLEAGLQFQFRQQQAEEARRPLDHKKFLDMLIDDVEEKYIELLEGTRSHTAVVDEYIKRIATALDDDFNTQFYEPAFRGVRETSYTWDVQFGQVEHTTVLCNNRDFAKVDPQATMEFDLPRRQVVVAEALNAAQAAIQDYGALINDPDFLALTKMFSGQPTSSPFGAGGPTPMVRNVLPGLPSSTDQNLVIQTDSAQPQFASQLEGLIPDPAIYKFETGTGFEVRPVIQPDGQAVVFGFDYMYSTNVREPVRADEKHLGRVKRHFIDTDVQLGNYELREISRYRVALRASRTARGVPLLEDIPGFGILFRPLPQSESSLQENIVLGQATIFPTLFDLMGLRWAPAVSDLDQLRLQEQEFVYRNRRRFLRNEVYDHSSGQVDEFLRIPEGDRRPDLYRTQETIPDVHPNSYYGPGLDRQDSDLQPGYDPRQFAPPTQYVPGATSGNTAPLLRMQPRDDDRGDGGSGHSGQGSRPGASSGGGYPPQVPAAPTLPPPQTSSLQPVRPTGGVAPELLPISGRVDADSASSDSQSGTRSVDEVFGSESAGGTGFAALEDLSGRPEAAVGQYVRPTSRLDAQNRPSENGEGGSSWRLWPFSRKENHRNNEREEQSGGIIQTGHEQPSESNGAGFRFRIPGFGRSP